jgi:hypothetical protein
MELTDRAKDIIILILQKTLTGQLDPSSHFNPRFVAEAITARIDFDKSYTETKNDKLIMLIMKAITDNQFEMNDELKKLKGDEKLLANFIHGKLTAYEEMLKVLNTL